MSKPAEVAYHRIVEAEAMAFCRESFRIAFERGEVIAGNDSRQKERARRHDQDEDDSLIAARRSTKARMQGPLRNCAARRQRVPRAPPTAMESALQSSCGTCGRIRVDDARREARA